MKRNVPSGFAKFAKGRSAADISIKAFGTGALAVNPDEETVKQIDQLVGGYAGSGDFCRATGRGIETDGRLWRVQS